MTMLLPLMAHAFLWSGVGLGCEENCLACALVAEGRCASSTLRRWFGHDPKKWNEFRRRYYRELHAHDEALEPIRKAAERGRVTLVYSSHDTDHNNAVALKDHLEARMGKKKICRKSVA